MQAPLVQARLLHVAPSIGGALFQPSGHEWRMTEQRDALAALNDEPDQPVGFTLEGAQRAAGEVAGAVTQSEIARLHPDDLGALAEHIARALKTLASPWMNTQEVADYLRCKVSRVTKLTSTGELPRHKDGSRNLYHRDEVDQFVRNGGAVCP